MIRRLRAFASGRRANRVISRAFVRAPSHAGSTWRAIRARSDAGFTIIEVMIACGLMLTAIMALLSSVISGLTATGLSRQRQSATSLANQTVEQVRALPLDRIRIGLNTADVTGDTEITGAAGSCTTAPCFRGEQLVVNPTASAVTPLNPHRQTGVTVGSTSFVVSTYLTWLDNDASADAFRVTTLVSWQPLSASSGKAEAQTILHYPEGCLSTATRPFSGPCVASYSSQGLVPAGTVHVEPRVGGVVGIAGLTFSSAEVSTPRTAADLRVEQIAVAESSGKSSGTVLRATEDAPQDAGFQLAVAQANNDPVQPGGEYSSETSPTQSAALQELTGGGNALVVNVASGGDTARAIATGSAGVPTNACPGLTGFTDKTDGLPCASSATQQLATTSAQLTLNSGTTPPGSATLASIGPQAAPSTVVTQIVEAVDANRCPSASGDGCAHVEVSRSAQLMELGGLPANVAQPGGWTGSLVYLEGYTDSATAAAGVGSAEPTAPPPAGVVRFWTGSAYEQVNVTEITADRAVPTFELVDASGVTVRMNAVVHPPSISLDDGCPAGCTIRPSASATSVPVTIDLHYEVFDATGTFADLDLRLDPGALVAGASYAPAPT